MHTGENLWRAVTTFVATTFKLIIPTHVPKAGQIDGPASVRTKGAFSGSSIKAHISRGPTAGRSKAAFHGRPAWPGRFG